MKGRWCGTYFRYVSVQRERSSGSYVYSCTADYALHAGFLDASERLRIEMDYLLNEKEAA